MLNDRVKLSFKLNGAATQVEVDPSHSLAKLVREQLGLMGTKVSCEAGECGACTVLVNGSAVNSCLILAAEVDGCEVITIEGLALGGELDVVQQAFLEEGAVQCGYCTAGMVMAAKGLLIHNPAPSETEILEALAGNLCRCTGYQRIVRAVSSAAARIQG